MIVCKMPDLMRKESGNGFPAHGRKQWITENQHIPSQERQKRENRTHRGVEFRGKIDRMDLRPMHFSGNPVDPAVNRGIFSAFQFQQSFPWTVQHHCNIYEKRNAKAYQQEPPFPEKEQKKQNTGDKEEHQT